MFCRTWRRYKDTTIEKVIFPVFKKLLSFKEFYPFIYRLTCLHRKYLSFQYSFSGFWHFFFQEQREITVLHFQLVFCLRNAVYITNLNSQWLQVKFPSKNCCEEAARSWMEGFLLSLPSRRQVKGVSSFSFSLMSRTTCRLLHAVSPSAEK